MQKRYERKDGSYLWAKVCSSVIPVVDREGPRIAVTVEDLSAQKAAEEALAKMQADLARVSRLTTMGELVASIAHEVNQPLAAIVANSHAALRWLERPEPNIQEVVAALQRAHRDATHAGNVIKRIRSFLKKEALKQERLDIPGMIDALLQMLQRVLLQHAITVKVRIAPSLPEQMGDQVQLQQVILNLLVNAIDAMRCDTLRTRRILIDVRAESSCGVLFSVTDTGPGIPESIKSAIFEPFHSTKSDGLGMGLAISRSIVDSHGGSLWLDETSPEGARFAFCLPVRPQ